MAARAQKANRKTPSRRSTPKTSSRGADRSAARPLKPFSVDHFRRYARNLILDDGSNWEPEDFQLAVVEDLFAGNPEIWMVVPEGNGKTTFTGGLALYHTDYEPSAYVPIAAASRDQCEVLHRQAAGFVDRTPGLEMRFRVFDGYRRITGLRHGGRIQVFAADDRTGDGVIPSLALLDELHRQRNLRLYRTWRGKLEKRGGQMVAISTAGEPTSEFEEIRGRLKTSPKATRDGAHTRAVVGGTVLHDWSVPADGDVEDMQQVKAANPLSTISVRSLRRKRSSATMSPQHWRRFVANQAVRSDASAVDEGEWAAAGTDEVIPTGEKVWAGIDLGWKWDCTAIVPLWMPEREHRLLGKPEILTPPRDGTSLHPQQIKDAVRRIHDRTPIHTAVMDPSHGGEELAAWMRDELGITVVEHSQTNSPMALAAERWLEALREGWLKQPRDPELTRHVLNAVARLLPDGRQKFDRASSSRDPTKQDSRVYDALDAGSMVHSVAVADLHNAIDPASYRIELL